jgi:hypothetical protein
MAWLDIFTAVCEVVVYGESRPQQDERREEDVKPLSRSNAINMVE